MSNNRSYCCNSSREKSDILQFFTKKKSKNQKKSTKKSKNQNWSIFDFSLIGSLVFELEPKTAKLRKQVELCPQGCFYLLSEEAGRACPQGCFYLTSTWSKFLHFRCKISIPKSMCKQIYKFQLHMLTTYQGGAFLQRCCSFGCQRGTELVFSCSPFYRLQAKQIFLLPFHMQFHVGR